MEKLLGVARLIELLGLQKKTLHNWLSQNKFNLKDHFFKVGDAGGLIRKGTKI